MTPAAKRTRRSPTRVATRSGARRGSAADVESQLVALEQGDGEGEVELGRGVSLHVSSLSKRYFLEAGITKGELMRYYTRISPVLLPHIAERPLVLKRYPTGVGGQMFFQQDAGAHVPAVVAVKALRTEEKGMRTRIVGGDLVTLLYTVQLGAIEVHPWLSRVTDIESADRCLIDLDPGDDVPFSAVVDLARDVLRIVDGAGLPAAVKTSGSTGMHVVIPLPARTSYGESAQLAMLVARAVAAARPDRATVERSIRARPGGTIYVDALQNARGKSAASAYSVRARAAATVSTPLEPRELTARLRMDAFTMRTVPSRVARSGDGWGTALDRPATRRSLMRALELLDGTLTIVQGEATGRSRSGRSGARPTGGPRRTR